MKQILAVLAFLMVTTMVTKAQLSNYGFSTTVSSFNPIVNDTILGDATNDEEVFNHNITPLYGPRKDIGFPIGFNFTYNNVVYDRFAVETNGYIVVGKDSFSINNLSSGAVGASLTDGYANVIAGFNVDLTAKSGSKLSYVTIGAAPNRQLVVQWIGYKLFGGTGADINFQIILNETTNSIQYIYGNNSNPSATSIPIQVGLRGADGTDYQTRETGIGWNQTTTGISNQSKCAFTNTIFPSSGLTFTFSIPNPCTAPPTPGFTVASTPMVICTETPFYLSVTGDSKGSGISYQWQSSVDDINWYDIIGETGDTYYSKGITTSKYFRRKITCSGQSAYTAKLQIVVDGTINYASLPFTEGFENSWTSSNCGSKDLPSVYWRNSPATGDTSWRRDDDGASANWSTQLFGGYSPTGSKSSLHSARFHSIKNQAAGLMELFIDASSGAATKELQFDYINTSGTDSLSVWLSTDGGNTYNQIGVSYGAALAGWTSATISFVASSATTILRFKAVGDFGSTDIGLDNVSVKSVSCSMPLNVGVNTITSSSGTGFWNKVFGALGYNWEVRLNGTPGSPGAVANGAVTDSFVNITGLTAQKTYNLYVQTNCGGATSTWAGPISFTTTPINDDCGNAIKLTLGGAAINGSCIAATQSIAPVACLGLSKLALDVWYKFVPNSSRATVTVVGAGQFDAIVQAFDTCGGIALGCTDQTVQNGTETLTLTNLNAGATYYVRVYTYINSTSGSVPVGSSFTIKVASPAIVPGITSSCTSVNSVTIDATNNTKWVALVDFSGRILAEINANGNNLGTVTGKVFINGGAPRLSTNGIYYLDRNIEITPAVQPTSPVLVKLYFLQTELNALINQAGSGVSSLNDIVVTKNADVCKSAQTSNGILLLPTDRSTFGTTGNVVTVRVNSFSSFYFHGGSIALPVELQTFTGERQGTMHVLKWTTTNEININGYSIEASTDGVQFATIGYIASKATNANNSGVLSYQYNHENGGNNYSYYKLKIVGKDGSVSYSKVVFINSSISQLLQWRPIYPNPTKDKLHLVVDASRATSVQIRVTDVLGKVLIEQLNEVEVGKNIIVINAALLSNGNYFVQCENKTDKTVANFKFVKGR